VESSYPSWQCWCSEICAGWEKSWKILPSWTGEDCFSLHISDERKVSIFVWSI